LTGLISLKSREGYLAVLEEMKERIQQKTPQNIAYALEEHVFRDRRSLVKIIQKIKEFK
jgi:hypothetical protein